MQFNRWPLLVDEKRTIDIQVKRLRLPLGHLSKFEVFVLAGNRT
jgi:hypothetical protein